MDQAMIQSLATEIVFYSIFCSFIVYGIKETIKSAMNKPKVNRFVGLGLTYAFGMVCGFLIKNEYVTNIYYKVIFGVAIGATTVGVYKTVVKSLLDLIPSIMQKMFGKKKETNVPPPDLSNIDYDKER